ncbi:hypothetical protein FA13DRAFT_1725701 [Coprinellus micaceus]|uniref:Endonuclease/exonuclease/phosphatase domain-containing protein n=1 Tax=Coprinellus micaceus TaxID=71717 RepID=A0A4Y7TVW0_COPMI|nr:hypothetical protein FA13DRAFT_1725701 [Coprinellus micaceus]
MTTKISRGSSSPQRLRLSLVTWNIDFQSPRASSRANHILEHVLEKSRAPDIIFLQEVRPDVHASLLDNPKVRKAFLTTGTEDASYFTMGLLSRTRFASAKEEVKFILGPVSRVELPSAYDRDGLCVDILPPNAPDSVCRLINVHLDSLWQLPNRTQQLKTLANALREPGCGGGLIAGDFNSINPGDKALIKDNGLEDAWLALHGSTDPDAPTWSLKPQRLDKVATTGLKVEEIEILHPGVIEVPKPGGGSDWLEWSDHSGLRCVFTI